MTEPVRLTLLELVSFVPPGAPAASLLDAILPPTVAQPTAEIRALGMALLDTRTDRMGLTAFADALERAVSLVAVKRAGASDFVRVAIGCVGQAFAFEIGASDELTIRTMEVGSATEFLFEGLELDDDVTATWVRANNQAATVCLIGGMLQTSDGEPATLDGPEDRASANTMIRESAELVLAARSA